MSTLFCLVFLFARTADLLWSTSGRLGVAGRLWLICSVYAGDKTWLRHRAQCASNPLSSSQLKVLHFPLGMSSPRKFFFFFSAQTDFNFPSQTWYARGSKCRFKQLQYMEVNTVLCRWRDRALRNIRSKQWPDALQFPDMKLIGEGKSTAILLLQEQKMRLIFHMDPVQWNLIWKDPQMHMQLISQADGTILHVVCSV